MSCYDDDEEEDLDVENDDDIEVLNIDNNKNDKFLLNNENCFRKRFHSNIDNEYGCDSDEEDNDDYDDEEMKEAGEGYQENDTFLIAHNEKSVTSV